MRGREKSKNPTIRDILYEAPGPRMQRFVQVGNLLFALLAVFLFYRIYRLFLVSGQLDGKYWSFFAKYTTWRFIGTGLLGTLEASLLGFFFALLFGFFMMLGRISGKRIRGGISTGLIEFTRGVPTLLFIYFFFLVVPQLGIKLPTLLRISLPVAISASGTVAELLRSGIQSVPKGQREAALSLGMSERKTFYRIIFPQGFRYVISALIADLVIIVKDTTFAYIVNFPDLMQNAKVLISNYDALLSVYLIAAIIYILLNYGLNKLSLVFAKERK